MSIAVNTNVNGTGLTPDELEAQIEVQRAQLADTVDQLAHKLDVKARLAGLLSQVRPGTVAAFVGAAALTGALVWWRRSR